MESFPGMSMNEATSGDGRSEGRGGLSHVGADGSARMGVVSGKPLMVREPGAVGRVGMRRETLDLIQSGGIPKGDVLAVARVAGIQAAKETARLIPLCHVLPISGVVVDFREDGDGLVIEAVVRTVAGTGVEMEALAAVSVAALTVYDMCKAVDKGMEIGGIRLLKKTKVAVGDG